MDKQQTYGENLLKKCGFELRNESTVTICEKLKYKTYEYIRYLDDKKSGVDMYIRFNISQDSIDICNHVNSKVFLEASVLEAIVIRAKEIGFMFPEIY